MRIVQLVPRSVKRRLLPAAQRALMARLRREVRTLQEQWPEPPSERSLARMISAWRNGGWAADAEYLTAVANHAAQAEGPILECGTGLSTLVAGIYGRHGVWSLEQHDPSRERIVSMVDSCRLDKVNVLRAPLVTYGELEWYQLPAALPDAFAMVVCDGPPGFVEGGRMGLMPILGERLKGAIVLLDDTDRETERAVVEHWKAAYGCEGKEYGTFTVLRAPADDGNVGQSAG